MFCYKYWYFLDFLWLSLWIRCHYAILVALGSGISFGTKNEKVRFRKEFEAGGIVVIKRDSAALWTQCSCGGMYLRRYNCLAQCSAILE